MAVSVIAAPTYLRILDSEINELHTPVMVRGKKQNYAHCIFEANDQIVRFQSGSPEKVGVNGLHNEQVLAMVIERLENFQDSPLACEANKIALEHLKAAQEALLSRTKDRVKRGVRNTKRE